MPVKYARGFTVDYYDGFKVITVKDWLDTTRQIARYVLLPKGKAMPLGFNGAEPIFTPVHKVACISTTHIGEMDRIGLVDSIVAVSNVPLIYDQAVRQKVKQGKIADIGSQEINYEKLLSLHPDFIFTQGGYDGGDKMMMKLNSLHIKSVLNLEYKEQLPLARAEWIKFIAAFYDREVEADSIFTEMELAYEKMKQEVKGVKTNPTVFCNLPFKEIWYMPCGENYMALLMQDAGGNFIWRNAKATNGLNLNLNYEVVYSKAAGADIWLNPGFAQSLAEIMGADKKNTLFKAFKTGMVYNNNKRNTPAGGFDFWESGVVNPDKVLADLIYIFHPEVLPKHQLYYYQKLK